MYRNGTVIFSSADRLWHYDDQYNHNVEEGTLQLREGDEIQTTCVYNSNDRFVAQVLRFPMAPAQSLQCCPPKQGSV